MDIRSDLDGCTIQEAIDFLSSIENKDKRIDIYNDQEPYSDSVYPKVDIEEVCPKCGKLFWNTHDIGICNSCIANQQGDRNDH